MNHMFYYYQMPGTNSSPFVGNTSAVQSPSTSDSTGQTLPSLSSLPMKQAPSIPSSAFSNGSLSNSPKLLHVPSPSFAPTSQFLPPQNNQGFQPNTISQSQSLLKSATLGSLMQHHSPQTNNIDTRQQQTQQILQHQQQLQQQQQQQQQLAANQFLQAMNSSFSNGAMGMLKASPAGLSTNLSYQHQFGSPVQQSLVQPHVSTLNSLSSISPADVFHATLLSGVQGNTLTQVAAPVDAAAVSTPKKPFQCNMCHKSFRDKNGFRSHMRIHTGEKPYECKECGRKFRDRSNLTRHTRTHTGDRPFPCTYCPKRFAHKHHLVDHLRTHTKEKPFTCMICSKSFSVKSTLKKHLTTHSNQKPHTCPHCSRCFSRRDYLGRHVDFCHCNPEVIKARESQAQERAAAAASSSSSTTTSTNN